MEVQPVRYPFGHAVALQLHPRFAFGFGVHHCVGAPLARLELRVLLSTLVRRLPELRLAISAEDLGWRRGGLMRGVTSLPVTG
jgi:cytochrome P450